MDIEREQANTTKTLQDELLGTACLQDYMEKSLMQEKLEPMFGANMIIPAVDQNLVKPVIEESLGSGKNRIEALLEAIQACIHPVTAGILAEKHDMDKLAMMIAATHVGVVRMSELFQITTPEEKLPIQVNALLFAAAQARLLDFRTSTTLLAIDIKDDAYLRLDNILVEAQTYSEKQLKYDRARALFRGYPASEIKDTGNYKFFIAGGTIFRT